jgi:hypothetical protein
MKVAILDDYQKVALRLADWSAVARHAQITVFNDHLADPAAVVERLRPFDVVCSCSIHSLCRRAPHTNGESWRRWYRTARQWRVRGNWPICT